MINVEFVLVESTHPGNIGSAARAIANMGFSQIVLVNPQCDHLAPVASARAAHAKDLLNKVKITKTLREAVEDSTLVFATRGNGNSLPWPECTPRYAAGICKEHGVSSSEHKISIIFGREKYGLYNEELEKCSHHIVIPTQGYSSLNLAQAIQVVAYELLVVQQELQTSLQMSQDVEYANASAYEGLYQHMEKTLTQINFLKPKNPKKLMPRLRSLFNRANVTLTEMQILRGIFSAVDTALDKNDE